MRKFFLICLTALCSLATEVSLAAVSSTDKYATSNDFTGKYEATANSTTFALTLDPADGDIVDKVFTIDITSEGKSISAIDDLSEDITISQDGSQVAFGDPSRTITNGVQIVATISGSYATKEFTDPGTYTVYIPEGFFTDNEGNYNEETIATYTIKEEGTSAILPDGLILYDGIVYEIISGTNNVTVACQQDYYYAGYEGVTGGAGDVVIPETFEYDGVEYTVTALSGWAFYYDYRNTDLPLNLNTITTSIDLPATIDSIGRYAIYGMDEQFTGLTCRAMAPPTLEEESAIGRTYNRAPLYVPCQSVEAYEEAEHWSLYVTGYNGKGIYGYNCGFELTVEVEDEYSDGKSLTVTISPEDINVAEDDKEITITQDGKTIATATIEAVEGEEGTWLVTFSETLAEGKYTMTIPEGYFENNEGESNNVTKVTFTTKTSTPSTGDYTFIFTPADSATIESLSTLSITNNQEGLTIYYDPTDETNPTGLIVVKDAEGKQVSSVPSFEYVTELPEEYVEGEPDTEVILTFDPAITTSGEYTVEIPGGILSTGLENTYEETITLTYIVTGGDTTVEPGPEVEEGLLYSTDFTDWETIDRTEANGEEVTVKTLTGGNLTFTLWGVGVDPTKTDEEKFPGYVGTMITSKYAEDGSAEYSVYEPFAVTSTLGTVDKIVFTQVATGGNRGIKVSVKGDGDEDWVVLYDKSISDAKGETIELDGIDRTNCRIKFESFALAQNGYIADLKIYGTDATGEAIDPYEQLYKDIKMEVDALGVDLTYAWANINLEHPESVEGLQSTYDAIKDEITNLQLVVKASHDGEELTADQASIEVQVEVIRAEIDALTAAATSINSITIDNNFEGKSIYTILGEKVSAPSKAGIYIIDGKKVVIK